MSNADATKKLLALKEMTVKGRRCVVVDPQDRQVKLRLHWLIHGVADDDVRTALAAFGKVEDVQRERWRVPGVHDKNSTTRTVLLKLKTGLKLKDLPHQVRFAGELALVVAPGRPMQCLRCQGSGHVRRDCKVPRCTICRRYGHEDGQCTRSYATATGQGVNQYTEKHLMDVSEAEEAAKGCGDLEAHKEQTSEKTPEGKQSQSTTEAPAKQPAAETGPATSPAPADEDTMESIQTEGFDAESTKTGMPNSQASNPRISPAVKRPLEGTANQQPPTGRRPSLKPRPNVKTERKATPELPKQHQDTGQPGGSEGV
ncbi:uncharacterized protein [Dermacentor albipictus]|uniref:uncharacterized protein n=1 Tax=Dermacentor albipictus TaxID=60249 RepID=UPI0038FD0ED0